MAASISPISASAIARTRDHGGLYYALPDGSKVVEVAYPILSPNGCGLSPDGKVLYVADTEPARLWAFDIASPGVVKKQGWPSPHGGRIIAGLGGFQRFDSLAVRPAATSPWRRCMPAASPSSRPDGNVVRQVAMPDEFPTNICFGGPDMRTAYVTLSATGRLGALDWPENQALS